MAYLAFLYVIFVAAWAGTALSGAEQSLAAGWLSVALLITGIALSLVVLA